MTAVVEADILMVGAGPVGLFATYYAGFRGLRAAVVDALPEVGGQISALYPEKDLYDIPGFPAVTGRGLIANLVAQAQPYRPQYFLGQEAQQLHRVPSGDPTTPERLVVCTSAGAQISTKAIVITGGIGTFTPRRLQAGTQHEGRGLAYFVPAPHEYAETDVVIVGGGDSAFDWAHLLLPIARSVTLVHRRHSFRAHDATVAAVREAGVSLIAGAQVTHVHGADRVEAVEVTVEGSDTPRRLPCNRIVAALGFVANLGPLRRWGLALSHDRHIVVDSAMRTNLPGVFAAGDITEHAGKVRLLSVGFGEAATAVNHAAAYIDASLGVFPGHSTHAAQPLSA